MLEKEINQLIVLKNLNESFRSLSKAIKLMNELTEGEDEQAIRVVSELNKFIVIMSNKYQYPII